MAQARMTLFAADHGLAAAGVSAYPQAVTRQMVLNFLAGGAAATVFAARLGVAVQVVDAGVAGAPIAHPALLDRRLGPGTPDLRFAPAMSAAVLEQALTWGRELGAAEGCDAALFGEMGIGNTAAAALLTHLLTGADLPGCVGPGTGLDAAGVARKHAMLEQALARIGRPRDPRQILAEAGGFEIAMMAGAFLGAAQARKPALVDGFIATAAALAAVRIDPAARAAMVFAHRSPEPGHGLLLAALEAEPLLDLGLRLGEGTGALLAWPLLQAAGAMLCDMASFSEAGVSGPQ
jgi:nicotinate-nucleotide--dimethylbenzimidazole phosphoribosyltransferase